MKLLLTSEALANDALADELLALCGRPASEISVAYVPTAAHGVDGDKRWLLRNLQSVARIPFREVDIVELSDHTRDEILTRFTAAQVIILGGGDAYRLLDWIDRLEIRDDFRGLAANRVVVGSSAGAMALGPSPALSTESAIWGNDGKLDPWRRGLELVDFYVRPHLERADFPVSSSESSIKAVAPTLPFPTYAIDDDSGVVVDGEVVRIVGSGRGIRFDGTND